jgi:MFS family permease
MDLVRIRKRAMAGLMAATAMSGIGLMASITVANVIGAEVLGRSSKAAGLPGTAVLLGAALTSLPLSRYMGRQGRRAGLSVGYLLGAAGGLVIITATSQRSFPVLLTGMIFLGSGYAAWALSRFAAGDMTPAASRAKAMSLITWTGVIGAVVGPNLLEEMQWISNVLPVAASTGPYVVTIFACLVAVLIVQVVLRPDPMEIGRMMDEEAHIEVPQETARTRSTLLRLPKVQVALAALVAGQLVMVMIMSMTALHMRGLHREWRVVGLVISLHLVGMFAFSPVSGSLADRFGRVTVIVGGAALIVSASVIAAVAPLANSSLLISLFLLGLGWNFGLVAGSALLTDAVQPAERPDLQGFADLVQSGVSAISGLVSGLIFAELGFSALGLIGASLMILPMSAVWARRRRIKTPVPEPVS